MKELSPAAQAVLHGFWDAPVSPARNVQIAAALRAAVEQIRFRDQLGLTAYGGHSQAQSQLLAIAAELEGSNV